MHIVCYTFYLINADVWWHHTVQAVAQLLIVTLFFYIKVCHHVTGVNSSIRASSSYNIYGLAQ
jgi:hypothetical protein